MFMDHGALARAVRYRGRGLTVLRFHLEFCVGVQAASLSGTSHEWFFFSVVLFLFRGKVSPSRRLWLLCAVLFFLFL